MPATCFLKFVEIAVDLLVNQTIQTQTNESQRAAVGNHYGRQGIHGPDFVALHSRIDKGTHRRSDRMDPS